MSVSWVIIFALSCSALALLLYILRLLCNIKQNLLGQPSIDFDQYKNDILKQIDTKLDRLYSQFSERIHQSDTSQDNRLVQTLDKLNKMTESLQNNIYQFKEQTKEQQERSERNHREEMRSILTKGFDQIATKIIDFEKNNQTQLDQMRQVVDEKLQTTLEKRLESSFKQVSERLEIVHKGLGEMQSIAVGVGDLKKTLSNVKTRGVLGEYQLGNILEQMLSPYQYSQNVATKRGSQDHVEYAVKLPGNKDNQEVWIPIDSKFPLDSFHRFIESSEKDDTKQVEMTQKDFLNAIETFAKTISDKYIDPPHTTDFAIMFLPIESLYAEVLRHPSLFETIQRKHRITITGPTTLSAFLNSLQMGYRTLTIQKRSSEVWKTLSIVKAEFEKFSDQLSKVYKQLNTATHSLDVLKNTRTNVLIRKLEKIEAPFEQTDNYQLEMNPIKEQNEPEA